MATNTKGDGSYADRSKFLVQSPHFFKVVMFPFDQGLKIPDAFMRKYGGDLQDIVLLKVPTGASWQVELVHYGNGTRLQKGWKEFAEYYSIKKLHFLVFRYEGISQFLVLIFDPTASEIEYPFETKSDRSGSLILKTYLTNHASERKRARGEDIEEDVSIEILDDLSEFKPRPRLRPGNRSSHRRMTENPHSRRKNAVKVDTNPYQHTESSGDKKAKQNQDKNWGCSKQKMNKKESSVGSKRPLRSPTSVSNCKTVIHKEKFKSFRKAEAFRSSKPFFISFMQPSYVSDHFDLMIPLKFAKDHLTIKEKCEFMLHISGKIRKWPVILKVSGERGRAGRGWKKFAQDNSLKVGDVCVFELVPGTRKFNITVYRSAEHEMAT